MTASTYYGMELTRVHLHHETRKTGIKEPFSLLRVVIVISLPYADRASINNQTSNDPALIRLSINRDFPSVGSKSSSSYLKVDDTPPTVLDALGLDIGPVK